MIRAFIARVQLWFRIMGLRADIAGYEDDLETIRTLGQQHGMAHALITAQLAETRRQLDLCTSRAAPADAITN